MTDAAQDPGPEPGLRVLLVEDETLNRALVRAIVARQMPASAGVELVEADSLAAARGALDRQPVDVVLLDVRLPDGNGLDLARELRETRRWRGRTLGAPLVAILSASVLAPERHEADMTGADAFLGKPFVPRDLVALLDRFAAVVRAGASRSQGQPGEDGASG